MLSLTAGGCSDTAFSNDLWDNLTSSKITSDKQITSFTINGYKARISGTSVTSVLPLGTSVTSLAPVITHNGAAVTPESGVAQNFTNPVTYTVTATDGTTEQYTVSVTVLDAAGMKNANLSVLKVKKGKLQPDFYSATLSYLDAPIPFSDSANPAYNDNQSNSLIADPEILIASMTINGIAVENGTEHVFSSIKVGPNPVVIKITSVDKTKTNTYTVNMYRAIPIFKTGAGSYSGINPLEDGATQRGVSWPNPRFEVHDNGTVTDKMTGLIWLKDARDFLSDSNFTLAVQNAAAVSELGNYNWKLPNIREMRSLINYGMSPFDYLKGVFDNCSSTDKFWTSTTAPKYTDYKYYTTMGSNDFNYDMNTVTKRVWAVLGSSSKIPQTGQSSIYKSSDDGEIRAGVEWPNPRFYEDESGTMVDNMTSLMWFKSQTGAMEWTLIFDSIALLNSGAETKNKGYHNWTLPNANELETLLNYGESDISEWLKPFGFDLSISVNYWTSTSDNATTPASFAIRRDFERQTQSSWTKSMEHNVLPVRLIKPSEMLNY